MNKHIDKPVKYYHTYLTERYPHLEWHIVGHIVGRGENFIDPWAMMYIAHTTRKHYSEIKVIPYVKKYPYVAWGSKESLSSQIDDGFVCLHVENGIHAAVSSKPFENKPGILLSACPY